MKLLVSYKLVYQIGGTAIGSMLLPDQKPPTTEKELKELTSKAKEDYLKTMDKMALEPNSLLVLGWNVLEE